MTSDIEVNMTPSHPGEFIRAEVLDELGLSVTRAAKLLGVSRTALSNLLNGRSSLSPDMATRIEREFNVSMSMLMRMQSWHDAAGAEPGAAVPQTTRRGD